MINELSKIIHENNKAKGFYEDEKNIGEMLALVHSEVSEALECDRKGKFFQMSDAWNGFPIDVILNDNDQDFVRFFSDQAKDTFEDELADIMIRVMDLAAFKNIDLESHIKAKMRYNTMRPYKHGKKY